jgi:peptidoglycan/xylan/chitin deacetylase (PgdA/CDA1 family)
MQKIIQDETGVLTTLLRFPGGSSNTVSKSYCDGVMTAITKKVEELGFQYFDWNVSSGDAGGITTKDGVFNNVTSGISKLSGDAVVLQHDTKKYSVEAVEEIIIWGLEHGYSFAALDMNSPTAHHPINN